MQQFQPLGPQRTADEDHPGEVDARPVEAGNQSVSDRVAAGHEHDRYVRRLSLGGERPDGVGDDHSSLEADQISQKSRQPIISSFGPALLDRDVAPVDKAGLAQALAKRSHYVIKRRRRRVAKEADDRYRQLLTACRKRRSRGRAAEQSDECAALHLRGHSITSSALACKVNGTARPSALAVFKFTTSSNLVGCMTGISSGRTPLRI